MVQMFHLVNATPAVAVEADVAQQQFGFSVAISGSLLLVGSPGYGPNASTFVGKVDAFDFPLVARPAAWSVAGDQPFARLGMTIAVAPCRWKQPFSCCLGTTSQKVRVVIIASPIYI